MLLQEAKEGCKKPEQCYKAGWLKKGTGRLLSSYKDCFVHVEKTELVVYENEVKSPCFTANAASSVSGDSYLSSDFHIKFSIDNMQKNCITCALDFVGDRDLLGEN